LPHKASDIEQDEEQAATQKPKDEPGRPQPGHGLLIAVDTGFHKQHSGKY